MCFFYEVIFALDQCFAEIDVREVNNFAWFAKTNVPENNIFGARET